MDIQSWMDLFLKELQSVFENRLIFVGLQGSRGRGEGRPDSDIDAVVVLDRLTPADLDAYEGLLDRLPNRELVCGFVSGREELAAWERSELFQFARDTRPWLGSLDEILPPVERRDIQKAVHAGACGIYHAAVHNRLHDRSLPPVRTGDAGVSRPVRSSDLLVLPADSGICGVNSEGPSRGAGLRPKME